MQPWPLPPRSRPAPLRLGVNPPSYPPPGMPPLEPMDMLLAPTLENLLATADVGRGGRGQSQPSTPTAPGICQTRPKAP